MSKRQHRRKRRRKRSERSTRAVSHQTRLSDDAPLLDPTGIPRWSCTIPNPPPPPPGLPKGPPPDRLLSDSLTRLIQPYIDWPPHDSELDQFFSDLCFGAEIWNVTLTAVDQSTCHRELNRIVLEHFDPRDHDHVFTIAKKISARKKEVFGDDNRLIVDIRLEFQGNQPRVYAIGAFWK